MRRAIDSAFAFLALLATSVPASVFAAPPESINLRKTVTVEVVERTKDAVCMISATKIVQQRVMAGPFWWDDGATNLVRRRADSLGSGFVIHPDGYVVTNHHVIDRAREIHVELQDGRKLPAELISSDSEVDLAVLKIISEKPLPTIELGDSADLMIGEPVIAVGNPLGFSHSVSTGIVSALHRDLKDNEGKVMLTDLIQTDAAINPGNSGGPLLNAYGQVIGVNTAIRGDAQNIGFAIQINLLRQLIPELMNPLHVSKIDVPLKLVEHRRVKAPSTVECDVLLDDGKQQLPIIRSIDGRRPANIVDAYALLLRNKSPDATITLELADGTKRTVKTRPAPTPSTIAESKRRLGLVVEQVTALLAEKLQLSTEDGLFITEVTRDSMAARSGLKPGDVITKFGRYPVNTLKDFGTVLDNLPVKGRVRVEVVRGNQVGYTYLNFQ